MKFSSLTFLLFATVFLATSCNREGCTDASALNFDEKAKKNDGSCIFAESSLSVPGNYSFLDQDGNNTVSFSGQTQRQHMLIEIIAYIESANTPGISIDSQLLKNMYANEGVTWEDSNGLGLNESTKNLKGKTAASEGNADPMWQAYFENLFDQLEAISGSTIDQEFSGGPGIAGVVQSSTNPDKAYLMNEQGWDLAEMVEKGFMGAVFYNQCTMWYLSNDEMNVDNSAAEDADNGKYYTAMEHHWDEAYGYLTDGINFPTDGTDHFWGKYADGRNDLLGLADNLSLAFRTGRAAIVAKDYGTRDAQIEEIRHDFALVSAATAIHYLNGTLENLADHALRNHQLSEAWAFIDALRFGQLDGLSVGIIDGWLATIGTDFYAATSVDLNLVKDELASQYGLTSIADSL
jgi:hypothetical protein